MIREDVISFKLFPVFLVVNGGCCLFNYAASVNDGFVFPYTSDKVLLM